MNTKNQHPLIGRWSSDEWSSVEINIQDIQGKIHVEAVDKSDGEKLDVKNLKYDTNLISFDLYTPSTEHICHHEFKYKGSGKAICKLSYIEEWELKE